MKITLERTERTKKYTQGELFVDGAFECYTEEDPERPDGVKVYGETSIPGGEFNVVITPSNRFKRDLPLLENVPNFSGIRIHPGNTPEDTDGCILVGRTKGVGVIGESRAAFAALFDKIKAALDAGDTVSIEIMDAA